MTNQVELKFLNDENQELEWRRVSSKKLLETLTDDQGVCCYCREQLGENCKQGLKNLTECYRHLNRVNAKRKAERGDDGKIFRVYEKEGTNRFGLVRSGSGSGIRSGTRSGTRSGSASASGTRSDGDSGRRNVPISARGRRTSLRPERDQRDEHLEVPRSSRTFTSRLVTTPASSRGGRGRQQPASLSASRMGGRGRGGQQSPRWSASGMGGRGRGGQQSPRWSASGMGGRGRGGQQQSPRWSASRMGGRGRGGQQSPRLSDSRMSGRGRGQQQSPRLSASRMGGRGRGGQQSPRWSASRMGGRGQQADLSFAGRASRFESMQPSTSTPIKTQPLPRFSPQSDSDSELDEETNNLSGSAQATGLSASQRPQLPNYSPLDWDSEYSMQPISLSMSSSDFRSRAVDDNEVDDNEASEENAESYPDENGQNGSRRSQRRRARVDYNEERMFKKAFGIYH